MWNVEWPAWINNRSLWEENWLLPSLIDDRRLHRSIFPKEGGVRLNLIWFEKKPWKKRKKRFLSSRRILKIFRAGNMCYVIDNGKINIGKDCCWSFFFFWIKLALFIKQRNVYPLSFVENVLIDRVIDFYIYTCVRNSLETSKRFIKIEIIRWEENIPTKPLHTHQYLFNEPINHLEYKYQRNKRQ